MLDKSIGRLRLKIEQDDFPTDPRENDNLGTMVCWHNRHKLGDEQPGEGSEAWLRRYNAEHQFYEKLPLYLYDHSGLAMNTTGFACQWDSGQVGWIVAELDGQDPDKVAEILRAEVAEYDLHLRGSVWCYTTMKLCPTCNSWEHVDTCGGFLAEDPREQMRECLDPEYHPFLED